MTLHVDPIEAFWVLVNGTTLVLTLVSLREARQDLALAVAANGTQHPARLITAQGNVRRELLRAVVQVLLLSIAIPGLFSDRPITLTPILVALIAVPVVLCGSTLFDRRERAVVTDLLARSRS